MPTPHPPAVVGGGHEQFSRWAAPATEPLAAENGGRGVILVTGATGNVGGELVRALLGTGQQVRGLTRDPRRAALADGADAVAGDLNRPESLSTALDGVRGVFLLSGFQDMAGVLVEIRRAGVERVVLLTSGAAAGGDLSNAVERDQIRSEAAVRESGLEWTILRPSGFHSNVLRWRPHLWAGDVVRAPFGEVPIASIDPYDIAAVAARALTAEGHQGRTYRLTGPQSLLPAEQVRVLAAVLGRRLRFEAQSDSEARAELRGIMASEYVDALFRFFVDGTYDDSKVLPTVQQLTGAPPRTFEQWATTHAQAFRTPPTLEGKRHD
jgi:uncharacterized protein YbjT (DUF2867 family)